MNDKLEIMNKFKRGVSDKALTREYGIGMWTISDIKKNGDYYETHVVVQKKKRKSLWKIMEKISHQEVVRLLFF